MELTLIKSRTKKFTYKDKTVEQHLTPGEQSLATAILGRLFRVGRANQAKPNETILEFINKQDYFLRLELLTHVRNDTKLILKDRIVTKEDFRELDKQITTTESNGVKLLDYKTEPFLQYRLELDPNEVLNDYDLAKLEGEFEYAQKGSLPSLVTLTVYVPTFESKKPPKEDRANNLGFL